MTLPDELPTPEAFEAWVAQSINHTMQRILRDLALDCAMAVRYRSMLGINSPLIARVLASELDGSPCLESDLAQIALQIEVPFLPNLSVSRLMDVRQNQGQAFESFRTALARAMRDLRSLSDPVERTRRIQDLSHEFANCQVQEVDAAAKRIVGSLALEGIVGVASRVLRSRMGSLFTGAWRRKRAARLRGR